MKPIVLDATTKKLQMIMSGAAATTNPSYAVSYADVTTTFTEGNLNGALNGTTAVDIVPAPAASTRRVVSEIVLYNADTAAVTVTFRLNDNGTLRIIKSIYLLAGETWEMSTQTAIDGAPGPAGTNGAIIQIKSVIVGTVATGTTVIPADNTIPQNTEGDQYMSLAITPTSATNKLRIDVMVQISSTGALIAIALFHDAVANADAAVFQYMDATQSGGTYFTHHMVAGTTSEMTFKVRAGAQVANTTTFNGISGVQYYGGVLASSITITEYVP